MPVTKRGSFNDFGDDDDLSDSFNNDIDIDVDPTTATNNNTTRQKEDEHSTGSDSSSLSDIDRDSTDRSVASSDNAAKVLGLDNGEGFVIQATRMLFFVFLLSSAAVLGWMVYLSVRNDQIEDFETQFDNKASEVLDLSSENVRKVLGVLNGLSSTMTAFMRYNDELGILPDNHPPGYITLPDVEKQFRAAQDSTGALILSYMPLVSTSSSSPSLLNLWNDYSEADQGWISKSNHNNHNVGVNDTEPILAQIWEYADDADQQQERIPVTTDDDNDNNDHDYPYFAPIWTLSPPPHPDDTEMIINYNLLAQEAFRNGVEFIEYSKQAAFLDTGNHAQWYKLGSEFEEEVIQTTLVIPVFDNFFQEESDETDETTSTTPNIVGHLTAVFPFQTFFENILSEGISDQPIFLVMNNTCDDLFTMKVAGQNVTIEDATKDIHDSKYNRMVQTQIFADFANPEYNDKNSHDNNNKNFEYCVYTISAYPTQELEDTYKNGEALWLTAIVFCVFLFTSMFFLIFDCLVHRRQDRVISVAMKQNAIVSSLFPKAIQAKMLAEVDDTNHLSTLGKAGLKSYLRDAKVAADQRGEPRVDKSKPIADLFPETTIMFADIAGFTAWSSVREPSMVFTLLETVYHFFDATAKRRRVFKVEVVGDCYVAVCGLPDPRKDHAVAMAKFAYECLRGMGNLTRELEVELGPETSDLGLRVGLHSGPVVAGVLRGEKSRFQLFGDTMNTASRMESTGVMNRIQISQDTAELLIAAKKGHWIIPREDKVQAKGKGSLTTYWLQPAGGTVGARPSIMASDMMSVSSGGTNELSLEDYQLREADESTKHRIADWTIEVLAVLLKEIAARRVENKLEKGWEKLGERKKNKKGSTTVIDEVEEIIMLPEFDADAARREKKADEVALSGEAFSELCNYVRTIASLYNRNPFHNFAHANHVTMSVTKLLSRIVAPDVDQLEGVNNKSLHDHTYGITSDPLTRFAVVLSALIHDVDHTGVSNMQLVKERSPIAEFYKSKSVAEQNSVDLAWNLLMEPAYENLRQQIYTTEAEFKRFRQLVVNTVMATDIMDKDLKKLRNDRWDKAFSIPPEEERKDPRAVNRKATIVIEHLIQASDVAHTMQHWHIYRKWNERLFREMYTAFRDGRMETDPSINWYKGEMGFFDFYIIPLAKKLKDCGVFGVSSYEYLSYAQQNRKEWEERGEEIVAEMVANAKRANIGDIFFAIQQDSVDPEGQKVVAEILDNSRRQKILPLDNNNNNSTERPTIQQAIHGKPPSEISTKYLQAASESSKRLNGSNSRLGNGSMTKLGNGSDTYLDLNGENDLDVDFDVPIKD